MKGEEVDKLVEVRDQMGKELEELTASLFEVYLFTFTNFTANYVQRIQC